MTQDERVRFLVDILLEEMPRFRAEAERLPDTPEARRRLLRGLMNVRPPMPLCKDFLNEQDKLLREETEARGVVSIGKRLQRYAATRQTLFSPASRFGRATSRGLPPTPS